MWEEYKTISFIGDIHGDTLRYFNITKDREHPTIQVGDFGFKKEHDWHERVIDPTMHKIVFGNHDYFPSITKPYSFGYYNEFVWQGIKIATVAGAFSIDRQYRTLGRDWFEQEEIAYQAWNIIFDKYELFKPDLIVAHTTPTIATQQIFHFNDITRTGEGLQTCLDIHRPSVFIHGHMHKSKRSVVKNTKYVSLAAQEVFDLNA